jgi:hypothetical protein
MAGALWLNEPMAERPQLNSYVPAQPAIDGLGHQIVLGVANPFVGRIDRIGIAGGFATSNRSKIQPPRSAGAK